MHFRQGLDGSAEDSGICWVRCNFTDDSLRLLYVILFVCDRDLLKTFHVTLLSRGWLPGDATKNLEWGSLSDGSPKMTFAGGDRSWE